ncbi:thioester domain-containing protein [Nocardiopsis sp. HNM0947]|uniref:Thioester domain-containing protein n=1 Tax=Nocardiopsis coralli TaxID=2772213 RepID=A0ABR9PDS5_9ACTN|nr:thioester domain-containing protein [Nocardiopsis coralli]MBE3002006.1 thioester domain-containing protein [Nocardiopsis coralli]
MKQFSLPRSAGRAGLSVTAAAALAFGLAAPAAADPNTYEGAARAQYTGNAEGGVSVTMTGGEITTNLFRLEQEGGDAFTAYCIDFETNILGGAWYLEDEWANYPGQGDFAEPGKVHWLLQNGYPSVGAEDLAEAAGANDGRATEEEALAATQAAIWHFSNDEDLVRAEGNVKMIYDHLVASAEPLPQGEPDATLSVSPEGATGQAGETVGEFTISTSAEEVPVTADAPEGVELVDLGTGEAVDTVTDGATVGFSVPEDADAGEASFNLETTSTVEQGRLFKGEDANEPTQTLITAEDSDVTVSAAAGVEWSEADEPAPEPEPEPEEPEKPEEPEPTPEPSEPEDDKPAPEDEKDEPELPVTGGALAGLVAAGIAALGAGGGALYLSRKRKAGITEDEV